MEHSKNYHNFYTGDWITRIDKTGEPLKVVKVDDEKYEIEVSHVGNVKFNVNAIDTRFKLWNVYDDAKDGDILCTYECEEPKNIFILKGEPKRPYALGYYCFYCIPYPSFITDEEKGCLGPEERNVRPATKEQRELLLSKIKDNGYTWNKDSKTLNKIMNEKENLIEEGVAFLLESAKNGSIGKCDIESLAKQYRSRMLYGKDFPIGTWIIKKDGKEGPLLVTGIISSKTVETENQTTVNETSDDKYLLLGSDNRSLNIDKMVCKDLYREWTINDAKSGDILVDKNDNWACIFKELPPHEHDGIHTYAFIDKNDLLFSGCGGHTTYRDLQPATFTKKKQFIKKIEDKGFVWNSDNLTLERLSDYTEKIVAIKEVISENSLNDKEKIEKINKIAKNK